MYVSKEKEKERERKKNETFKQKDVFLLKNPFYFQSINKIRRNQVLYWI